MCRILFFGDSNTWGHDPKDGTRLQNRWTVLLKDMLKNYEIVDDGVCGRAVKYRIPDNEETDGLTVFRKRYTESDNKYQLVVIMLGTNDTLNINHYTPEEIADDIKIMVREYREKHGNVKFLLAAPIHISQRCMEHPVFSELYSMNSVQASREFAKYISAAAKDENTYFMDAAQYARPSEIDGIHMEESEHKKLAQAFKNKIEDIFQGVL